MLLVPQSKYSGKNLQNPAGRPDFANFFPLGPSVKHVISKLGKREGLGRQASFQYGGPSWLAAACAWDHIHFVINVSSFARRGPYRTVLFCKIYAASKFCFRAMLDSVNLEIAKIHAFGSARITPI